MPDTLQQQPLKVCIFAAGKERTVDLVNELKTHKLSAAYAGITEVEPDYQLKLTELDNKGFDIAIIDDATLNNEAGFLASVRRFIELPRSKENHLRVIFFGAQETDGKRGPTDKIWSTLATIGIYDLVRPYKDEKPIDKLAELITYPAKKCDVATLIDHRSISSINLNPSDQPKSPDKNMSEHDAAILRARGKSSIVVVSTMPERTTTDCSIVLARNLVQAMQDNIALVVNKEVYKSFKETYRYAESSDGKCFRVNGVDFHMGSYADVVGRGYSYAVVDMGYLNLHAEAQPSTTQETNALIDYYKADLRVVYAPYHNPMEKHYLEEFINAHTPQEINDLIILVEGATDELFAAFSDALHAHAPRATLVNLPSYAWPIALDEVNDDLIEALLPVLPKGFKQKRTIEKKAAAQASEPTKKKSFFGLKKEQN